MGACGAAAAAVLVGCGPIEAERERHRPTTPREAYALALREAGLASTALARDWIAAGEAALRNPLVIEPPFRETGYLPPERPTAHGYLFHARRGHRLTVALEVAASDSMRMFVDLFEAVGASAPTLRLVASADSGSASLEFEPRRDGTYVLRIQPELLRGGRYTVMIVGEPALAFPVEGAGESSIRSVFGDPRDGGLRDHHGVDIFAPRGTPVVAAAEGTVTRVRTTPIGGKVVWVRDDRRAQSFYYAHLDSQLVAVGQRVRPGDTLGLVGNTGNAHSTPPHLHFGIYRRGEGPVDPRPFIVPPAERLPPLEIDSAVLGGWARTARDGIGLRVGPDARAPRIADLPLHTAMHVVAASGRWYRVRLPDGTTGYVASWLIEPIAGPIQERHAREPAPLLARPQPDATVVGVLRAGAPLPVLGRFRNFLPVQAVAGSIGWVPVESELAPAQREVSGHGIGA